jgi:hypothetical protein
VAGEGGVGETSNAEKPMKAQSDESARMKRPPRMHIQTHDEFLDDDAIAT